MSFARKSLIAADLRQLVIPTESRLSMGGNREHAVPRLFRRRLGERDTEKGAKDQQRRADAISPYFATVSVRETHELESALAGLLASI